MSKSIRDRIAGTVLLAIALVWIVLVFQTIESSQGVAAGARAFPLFFGIVLAGLSVALLAQSFRTSAAPAGDIIPQSGRRNSFEVVAVIGGILLYGFVLEPLGFIPATLLIVVLFMTVILRLRAPLLVAGMAVGLSLGCYLVFGKLLGTYLPPGRLITIYF